MFYSSRCSTLKKYLQTVKSPCNRKARYVGLMQDLYAIIDSIITKQVGYFKNTLSLFLNAFNYFITIYDVTLTEKNSGIFTLLLRIQYYNVCGHYSSVYS